MKRKAREVRDSIALEERESTRTGTSVTAIKQAILDNLYYIQGRTRDLATRNDWYMAVAYMVRDRMLNRFVHSLQDLARPEVKSASYLSAEFLMGPHLGNNLLCLGIADQVREAVNDSEFKRGTNKLISNPFFFLSAPY